MHGHTFQHLILRQTPPIYILRLGEVCLPQLGEEESGDDVVTQREGYGLGSAGNL